MNTLHKSHGLEGVNMLADKFLLFLLVFFSVISPKTFKDALGNNAIWIYPQYVFGAIILLRMMIKKQFKISFTKVNIFFMLLVLSYFSSMAIAMVVNTSYYRGGFNTTLKVLLDFIFIVLVINNLYSDMIKALLNSIIITAVMEVLIELYGIFVFYNLLPATKVFKAYCINCISKQQFLYFYNVSFQLPRWGATFPESQFLSMFLLMAYIAAFIMKIYCENTFLKTNLNKKVSFLNKYLFFNKEFVINKYSAVEKLFFCAIMYNFSKAVIIALLIFIFLIKIEKVNVKLKKRVGIGVAIFIGILLYLLLYPELSKLNSADGAKFLSIDNASSFLGRIIPVKVGLELMCKNVFNFIFGLGPRQFGICVRQAGISPNYNMDTSVVSMFQMLLDVGFLGISIFSLFIFNIFKGIKNNKVLQYAFLSVFIANFTNPEYLSTVFLIYIFTLVLLKNINNEM